MPTIASSLAADSPVTKLGLARLCRKAATAIANLQAGRSIEVSKYRGARGSLAPPARGLPGRVQMRLDCPKHRDGGACLHQAMSVFSSDGAVTSRSMPDGPPLPEHPELRSPAMALETAAMSGEILDAKWRGPKSEAPSRITLAARTALGLGADARERTYGRVHRSGTCVSPLHRSGSSRWGRDHVRCSGTSAPFGRPATECGQLHQRGASCQGRNRPEVDAR